MTKVRNDITKTLYEVQRTKMDLHKKTGISLKRLKSGINGSLVFRRAEETKIRQALALWIDEKEEVFGY